MTDSYRKLWLAALAAFVLAGSTGAFLRFGILYGMAGLNYVNVRHAHSHLMYFGWVTPALMALIATQLPRLTGRPNTVWLPRTVFATVILGVVAYVPFLFFGYQPAAVGGVMLPLSVVASALNVVAWYGFAWLYRRQTKGAPGSPAIWFWNAAVAFLLLSTAGVLGLPLLMITGVESPLLSVGLTHFFLDLFSEGWIVLAGFGLLFAAFPAAAGHRWARRSGELLLAGLPVVFLLTMPTTLLPPAVRWVGSVGGLLVAAGTLGLIVALWPHADRGWRVPLLFLGLKAITQLGLVLPAVARWAELSRMRVPYLHWLLLGFATLLLFCAAERVWGVRGRRWMTAAVILLTLTLLPLTGLWPPALAGRWTLHLAAWAALGPVIVAIAVLIRPQASPRVATPAPAPRLE